MTTKPRLRLALALSTSALLAGCAQTGPLLPRRTTLGSLKTSVSHLEFENDQLRRQMAKVESDKREVEDRLAQEEWANGDLAKRLDDARHELSQRGVDVDGERTTRRRSDGFDSDQGTTIPARRSNRKPRKAPFAQIPGHLETAPPSDPADDPSFVSPKDPLNEDLGPQSWFDSDRWLPIARGTSEPSKRVR